MTEKWRNSQWQTGLKQRCGQTCGINNTKKGVSMAEEEVQIVDKTKIVTMIVSVDETKGVDTIALAWHWSS